MRQPLALIILLLISTSGFSLKKLVKKKGKKELILQ